MKKYRIIVAGGRYFKDRTLAFRKLDHYLSKLPKDDILIIEGGAEGADRLGREYAIDKGLPYHTEEASWDNLEAPGAVVRARRDGKKYNAKAGFDRNEQMALHGTHLVAFWDGQSKGTKSMIDLAEELGLRVAIVHY